MSQYVLGLIAGEPAAVRIEDGAITAVTPRTHAELPKNARVEDFGEALVAPGLVDLHVHGGAGEDFMSADAAGLRRVREHLARHGVTTFLATTVSAPWAETLAAVERLANAGLELHLEGPFLSSRRRGVHREADLLAPRVERLEELWQRAQGRIRMITMAPELEGALEFIRAAAARGIVVSLGHSDASAAQAREGIAAGARHVTHCFNAMRPLHHREPGLLGEALNNPALSAEIIADGVHVDPRMVGMFLRLKGPERAVLVSDAISATGCGDGVYKLGGIEVRVSGGCCTAGGVLAGSVLTLDRAVRNARESGGLALDAAVRLASENPARVAGLERKGSLAVGADADISIWSPGGELLATFAGGSRVN